MRSVVGQASRGQEACYRAGSVARIVLNPPPTRKRSGRRLSPRLDWLTPTVTRFLTDDEKRLILINPIADF